MVFSFAVTKARFSRGACRGVQGCTPVEAPRGDLEPMRGSNDGGKNARPILPGGDCRWVQERIPGATMPLPRGRGVPLTEDESAAFQPTMLRSVRAAHQGTLPSVRETAASSNTHTASATTSRLLAGAMNWKRSFMAMARRRAGKLPRNRFGSWVPSRFLIVTLSWLTHRKTTFC